LNRIAAFVSLAKRAFQPLIAACQSLALMPCSAAIAATPARSVTPRSVPTREISA
jgi:hypothetical protein